VHGFTFLRYLEFLALGGWHLTCNEPSSMAVYFAFLNFATNGVWSGTYSTPERSTRNETSLRNTTRAIPDESPSSPSEYSSYSADLISLPVSSLLRLAASVEGLNFHLHPCGLGCRPLIVLDCRPFLTSVNRGEAWILDNPCCSARVFLCKHSSLL
jgi:hypothetical protein